jgi:predicted metal-dependent peptidase
MERVLKKLTKARISLIRLQPFFGVAAMHLPLVEDTSLDPPTLATDGEKIYYHPKWVDSPERGSNEVEAGLAHEVGHVMLMHSERRNGRDAQRWNAAVDYEINQMLVECGYCLPSTWLYDRAYIGMIAEEIYALLPDISNGQRAAPFDKHAPPGLKNERKTQIKVVRIQAAKAQQKMHGSLPGSIKRLMDELTAPKVNWRGVLRRFATERTNDDYSWAKPNRAYLSLGYILPALYSEGINDITTVIDTSGSIDAATLNAFGSEIADIKASLRPRTTRVIYCDTDVNHVNEFEEYDEPDFSPYGGGGTDFRPPFKWLEERSIQPNCLVYLTDGYGSFPDSSPEYPVLWLMTSDVTPPWGESVRVKI